MRRMAEQELLKWRESQGRKPLLIHGARQVGKTWLMRTFGNSHYKNVAYFNFERNPTLKHLFSEGNMDPHRILIGLGIDYGKKITAEDTLIILDEIQQCPEAITSLKYFCEETPSYHIMAAGSLLGVALHKGISYPVGKVDTLSLYPLNFLEYLWAMGEKALTDVIMSGDLKILTSVNDKWKMHLKYYFYIGGMPAVVKGFSDDQDFFRARSTQLQLIEDYERDFSKHVPSDEFTKVKKVWASVAFQLAKENKRFKYNDLKPGARARDFESAIEWLVASGLVYKVGRVSKPSIPLTSYIEDGIFKLYLVDIGLLGAMAQLDVKTILEGTELFKEFKGALTEQYVCQQLKCIPRLPIAYWVNESARSEIDFLIQVTSSIIPLEVKSSTNLKAKSLQVFRDKYSPKIALRTSLADYKCSDSLVDLPLCAISNVLKVSMEQEC